MRVHSGGGAQPEQWYKQESIQAHAYSLPYSSMRGISKRSNNPAIPTLNLRTVRAGVNTFSAAGQHSQFQTPGPK